MPEGITDGEVTWLRIWTDHKVQSSVALGAQRQLLAPSATIVGYPDGIPEHCC
jgi:hypothetical protein